MHGTSLSRAAGVPGPRSAMTSRTKVSVACTHCGFLSRRLSSARALPLWLKGCHISKLQRRRVLGHAQLSYALHIIASSLLLANAMMAKMPCPCWTTDPVPLELKSAEARLQFYLGSENGSTTLIESEPGRREPVVFFPEGWSVHDPHNSRHALFYEAPLKAALARAGLEGRTAVMAEGDLRDRPSVPYALVKNRSQGCSEGTIIRCMSVRRHWEGVRECRAWKRHDPKFESKRPAAIWRGTTTGRPEWSGSRFKLVEEWFDRTPETDVGFSHTGKGKDRFEKYVKGRMSREEMLKYRYIISARGNDKDSGLNWKLCSNSVVLMCPPETTSWLMESILKPWVHYVPLRSDFKDLQERVKWCENHLGVCAKISENARRYMAQFMDEEREKKLENEVLRLHCAQASLWR